MAAEEFALFVASPRLLGLAYQLVHDERLAEDVLQETLAKLYLRWGRVQNPEA